MRLGTVAALSLVVGVIVAVAGCGDEERATPGDEGKLAVEEGYARLAEAISRPGHVFHARVEEAHHWSDGTVHPDFTRDVWIDLSRDTGRQELQVPGDPKKTFIVVGDTLYGQGGYQYGVEVCPGTHSAVLSLIPDCMRAGPFHEPFAFWVEHEAEYEGQAAVTLVVQSIPPTPKPDDLGRYPSVHNWLYLERDSFLPIAKVAAGRSQDGKPPDSAHVSSYENEFIAADSLPADFLDPVSLGPAPTPPR